MDLQQRFANIWVDDGYGAEKEEARIDLREVDILPDPLACIRRVASSQAISFFHAEALAAVALLSFLEKIG
jgi:hypothetical protein